MIGVSACLAGENCTYAGKNNLQKDIKRLVDAKKQSCYVQRCWVDFPYQEHLVKLLEIK